MIRRSVFVSALMVVVSSMLSLSRAQAEERSAEPLISSLTCSGVAQAVDLACHSWTEIDAAQKAGTRTVIVPIGGTEQSGPYMAVGKHTVRAHVLADRIAQAVGQTFVAPTIAYVPEGSTTPRRSHMRFPGTLSLPPDVFTAVVTGAAESLRVQGFETIVVLGDHGGYQNLLMQVARKLNQTWARHGHSKARIVFVRDYYQVIPTRYADILRQKGYGQSVGKHADLSDTSLTLAVDPSLVRQEALRHAEKPQPADGVYGGDPRQASAELGRIGTDMQVQAAVDAISLLKRSHP